MDKLLQGALVCNAASLGFNWVYNMPYLEKLAQKEDLLFQEADPSKYKRARKAFYAYPEATIGDVSVQGEIAKWLFSALKECPGFTPEDYTNLLLEKFKPGGVYTGWVESYGKKLVLNALNTQLKTERTPVEINDNQLVAFVPYLVTKTLNLGTDKAWAFASTLTRHEEFLTLYHALDRVLDAKDNEGLNDALKASISHAPKSYQESLKKAFEYEDYKAFIKDYAGPACSTKEALPLIYHILAHSDTFEAAAKMNTLIGGASSDRGMLIGAIMSRFQPIPNKWIEKTHLSS